MNEQIVAFRAADTYHHAHPPAGVRGADDAGACPMTRSKKPTYDAAVLTPQRAARLFRLLSLLGDGSQTRVSLLKRLKLDLRGFYRDLEFLRSLGVEYSSGNHRYALACDLDTALARLPFPDPGLSLKDALQLARGSSEAHRKLRKRIESVTGAAGRNHVL